jgi:hypothetical protein
MTRKPNQRPLLGWREWVLLPRLSPVPLKAKIDTGARTSSLHAFDMSLHTDNEDPWVEFEIHPIQRSRAQPSRVSCPIRGFKQVRSSTGHSEKRPVIRTPIRVGAHEFDIDVTLTSRDEMGFRMLLGRAAIRRRFWVDPGRSFLHPEPPHPTRKKDRRPRS